MSTQKRTDEEILQRIKGIERLDWLGFKTQVLVVNLSFEAAKPFLKDEIAAEEWAEDTSGVGTPAEEGAKYLPFAIGKIENERGISANRSVQKFAEWAWLDGEDDLAVQIDDDQNYGWYGDRAVRLYAEHYGLPWTREGEEG